MSTAICSASIYPTEYPPCLVVMSRWTFHPHMGCISIAYYLCGQSEEGYNVFADQEACEKTCGRFITSKS